MSRPREEFGRAIVGLLARARLDAGLTRARLSERAGVSAETIAKIERGATTNPGFTLVVALTSALDLSIDALAARAKELTSDETEVG